MAFHTRIEVAIVPAAVAFIALAFVAISAPARSGTITNSKRRLSHNAMPDRKSVTPARSGTSRDAGSTSTSADGEGLAADSGHVRPYAGRYTIYRDCGKLCTEIGC